LFSSLRVERTQEEPNFGALFLCFTHFFAFLRRGDGFTFKSILEEARFNPLESDPLKFLISHLIVGCSLTKISGDLVEFDIFSTYIRDLELSWLQFNRPDLIA